MRNVFNQNSLLHWSLFQLTEVNFHHSFRRWSVHIWHHIPLVYNSHMHSPYSSRMLMSVLSISFEVDVSTGKVGGSVLFERRRRELPRGVWGHASPRNIWNLDAWKCGFQRFSDSIWALRTIKIKTILTIIYSMFITTILFLNFSHWLLEKSEMINLQMLIQKKIHSMFLVHVVLLKKTCSAMSASVSLAGTPFYHMRKPGI